MPDAKLFSIHMMDDHKSEFNTIIHLLSIGYAPEGLPTNQKKHLVVRVVDYTLIVGHLYKLVADEILRRCVFDYERPWVMSEAHASVIGGHYAGKETMHNILQFGLWWSTIHMDTKKFF